MTVPLLDAPYGQLLSACAMSDFVMHQNDSVTICGRTCLDPRLAVARNASEGKVVILRKVEQSLTTTGVVANSCVVKPCLRTDKKVVSCMKSFCHRRHRQLGYAQRILFEMSCCTYCQRRGFLHLLHQCTVQTPIFATPGMTLWLHPFGLRLCGAVTAWYLNAMQAVAHS